MLREKAFKHIWYPGSKISDYDDFTPLVVTTAYGSYLESADGKKVIDAISSWWCKSLGHKHPRLQQALVRQTKKFEHIIMPGTMNETIVELSERLANLTATLKKVFYASDGSTAVEIALKMSLHAQKNLGHFKKTNFIALSNGYHGETIGALSVSDIRKYKAPYKNILFDAHFIPSIPYIFNVSDPLWTNCLEYWSIIESFLEPLAKTSAALILEPIVQGAAGMKIYSQDFLKRLKKWARENNIYLIADEIMTGLGRTGKMFACEYADIEPDFLCIAKGLTAGWLPLSAVLTTNNIYELFYDHNNSEKTFWHSNTHYGNALAASVAIETLNIIEEENLCNRAMVLESVMLPMMQEIADSTQRLSNIRSIGAIVAADLIGDNLGLEIHKNDMNLGAYLRPIGNTIYWLPPLNTNFSTLEELGHITKMAITNLKRKRL